MENKRRPYRWLRRTLRILGALLVIFIIACFVFDQFVQFRKPDDELRAAFRERGVEGRIGYYTTRGRTLRYAVVGADSLPTLLMLHGSPGSMSYYAGRYADTAIQKKFRMITVDRPGYGYSELGNPEPSIAEQAALIRPLLDSLIIAHHPVIIAGGSYGSSVACRLAMDYPQLVDGLVLTGPSLGPGLEKMFWFTPLVEHWSIRWFIPRIFRSANTEKIHHKEELEKMLPLWKNIRVPVVYMQGAHDELIDTANAGFARKHLVNAPYLDIHFFENRHHRLAQFEWPAIRNAILRVYDKALRISRP